MALHKQFENFPNEAAFTIDFIIPLLRRLGYSTVVYYHGRREFGRDVIFAEIDRFGHIVYGAMQVKFQGSISQSDSHKLVEDARESFGHPFEHPERKTSEFVSRFYVANAGSISDNARSNIFSLLDRATSANTVLLGGHALVALNQNATATRDGFVAEVLTGLLLEFRTNRSNNLYESICNYATEDVYTFVRYRLTATTRMLDTPVVNDYEILQFLYEIWHHGTVTNSLVDSADTPLNVPEMKKIRFQYAKSTAEAFLTAIDSVQPRIEQLLADLGRSF